MRKLLDETLARFEELEHMMTDAAVLADSGKMQQVAREHGTLAKTATKYRRFKQLNAQIEEAGELLKSGDGCFRQLQFESGGHRVQRVPETEAKGRIIHRRTPFRLSRVFQPLYVYSIGV